jgi:hypothetical protein
MAFNQEAGAHTAVCGSELFTLYSDPAFQKGSELNKTLNVTEDFRNRKVTFVPKFLQKLGPQFFVTAFCSLI